MVFSRDFLPPTKGHYLLSRVLLPLTLELLCPFFRDFLPPTLEGLEDFTAHFPGTFCLQLLKDFAAHFSGTFCLQLLKDFRPFSRDILPPTLEGLRENTHGQTHGQRRLLRTPSDKPRAKIIFSKK